MTVVSREAWEDACRQIDVDAPWTTRRANLLVSSVELADTRGKILRVGGCRLLIHGETRPCERMEAAMPGLRQAMAKDWRGGVYCEALDDGIIAVDDAVSIEEA